MTEPTASRPVPGPYRPARVPPSVPARGARPHRTSEVRTSELRTPRSVPDPTPADSGDPAAETPGARIRLTDLDGLPVVEHVAVFETEHTRLQRELGTIDRL